MSSESAEVASVVNTFAETWSRHDMNAFVEFTVRALREVWTGDSDPETEIHAGHLNVLGAGRRGQTLWRWLGRSMFAPTRIAVRS